MQLTLNVPDQHEFTDPTVETRPQQLKNWLAALPILDTAESLYQVLGALEPLNEQKIDTRLRYRLLNTYQPVVLSLYEAAAPDDLSQKRLPQLQQALTADYVERLCLAMANGYKIVLKEWFAENRHQDEPALFARALRRASRQLGLVMLHSYRTVRPQPAFLMLETHQLYRLARHFGLQDLTDVAPDGRQSISIGQYYQAVMMFSRIDHCRVDVARVDRLFGIVLRYANRARITAGNHWEGGPAGLFFIDLAGDAAPQPCRELVPPVAADDACLLDCQEVVEAMHEKLASAPPGQRSRRPESILLKALTPA